MSTELLLNKTKRLEMYDIIKQVEKLNDEVNKLRSRSIDLETDIDAQFNAERTREIHNQKVLPLIKSFDLSYGHPLVVQDIWPKDLWPEKPLEARHDSISDSEEETNYVCIQKGVISLILYNRLQNDMQEILNYSHIRFQIVIHCFLKPIQAQTTSMLAVNA